MKKKVCYFPTSAPNDYVNISRQYIKNMGMTLSEDNNLFDRLTCDIVHLNWYDELMVDSNFNAFILYILKILFLKFWKISRKKIVYTLHNKQPHDIKNRNKYCHKLNKWLIKNSTVIIIHSYYSKKYIEENYGLYNKIRYVPHPNYLDIIKNESDSNYSKTNKLRFLLFGLIRPYKNVDVFIECANNYLNYDDIEFFIFGKCDSDEYIDYLRKISRNPRVKMEFRYIDNNEVSGIFNNIDVLVLPYNTESALNSGAAFMAFTLGKTVVSTRTGTIIDLDGTDLVYSYDYIDDKKDHITKLSDLIGNIYDEYKKDNMCLYKKGQALRDMVIKNNGYDSFCEKLKNAYGIED